MIWTIKWVIIYVLVIKFSFIGPSQKKRKRHARTISLGEYLPQYIPSLELDTKQDEIRVWQRKSPEKESHENQEYHAPPHSAPVITNKQTSFKSQERSLFLGQKEEKEEWQSSISAMLRVRFTQPFTIPTYDIQL